MENKTLKTSSQLGNRKTMRTITLEEDYATPGFIEGPGHHLKGHAQAVGYVQLVDQLCDLDDHRIADMDAAGIDVQVLSLTAPGVQQSDAMEAVVLTAMRTTASPTRCDVIRAVLPGLPHCRPRLRTPRPMSWNAWSLNTASREQ